MNSCTCEDEDREEHTCPFHEDVHDGEPKFTCTCCEYCVEQCADDI
jgi:hypothetical protein